MDKMQQKKSGTDPITSKTYSVEFT